MKKRHAGRKRGGSKGRLSYSDDIQSIVDVRGVLVEAVNELRSSPTESVTGKCRAVGYLCGILLTALEKSDLEERVAKLEELLADSTT